MVERRVGRGAVEGVSTSENRLFHSVGVAVLNERARAVEVHAHAVRALVHQVRHRRHVDRRIGSIGAEYVLGGALSNVGLVNLDLGRPIGPSATIDAHDIVTPPEELQPDQTSELARDSCHQNFHHNTRSSSEILFSLRARPC